jgi:hypothetical protein
MPTKTATSTGKSQQPVRVLCITDQLDFKRWVEHHLEAFLPSVTCVQHSPALQSWLHEAFLATGYDLVMLDGAADQSASMQGLVDLNGRKLFAPIVYFALTKEQQERAITLGTKVSVSRVRFNHREFAATLRELIDRRRRLKATASLQQSSQNASRFDGVLIRGHRFIESLGGNAASKVYLAESEKEGAIVALKVFSDSQEKSQSAEHYERFMREYQWLASINHPNIAHIYDFGVADDHAFIVMEYFQQGDLRRRMQQPISVQEALNYIEQIAQALAVVHRGGILHRDIKPGNIMLRNDDTVVLIDFGVALQMQSTAKEAKLGNIIGTPYYMSPEQGYGEAIDERSDLYSLGVMLYELLMQKRPYVSDTTMNLIYMHKYLPLPILPPQLAWLQPLIDRLMAKDPQHRFQSAEELIATLSAAKNKADTVANNSSKNYQ